MLIERTAEQEILRLKARYFRCLDTKDIDGLDEIFMDDAIIDVRGSTTGGGEGSPSVEGLDDGIMSGRQLKSFFRSSIADLVTVHHGHMPEIEVHSESSASGIWALEDRIWFPAGSPYKMMHGWGHYHDTYVRHEGRWRVSAMRISRLKTINEKWD